MEEELKPFWLDADCPDSLDPDWVPSPRGIVMDANSTDIIMCDECPCPPCPYCPSCNDTWHPVHESGNYFELWGIPCGGDCETDTPRLLGVYNTMEAYEKYGWVGCYWSEHLVSDPPGCVTWLGVDPGCGLVIIGREQVCTDDPCRDRMIEIVKECNYHNYWHQRSTGWLYNPDNMSNMKPVTFVWVSWYYNEKTGKYKGWLRALDCDCYETLVATAENLSERPSSPEAFGYKFVGAGNACDDDNCQAKISALLALATQNGWIMHGEGVMAHLATCSVDGNVVAYGDWYAVRNQVWTSSYGDYSYSEQGPAYSRFLCAAETPDGYWALGCNCEGPVYYEKNNPVPGYNKYFELGGVCGCSWSSSLYPDRELLLTYPDMFGVDDIVWGNDNKFDYAYTGYDYGPDGETMVPVACRGCGVCGYVYEVIQGTSMISMYIDYRAMCFTGNAFDRSGAVKKWIRVIYPDGSRGAPYRGSVRTYFARPSSDNTRTGNADDIYDTVAFTGTQMQPFARDPDLFHEVDGVRQSVDNRFGGQPYTWFQSDAGMYWSIQVNGDPPTEVCDENLNYLPDAEEQAGCSTFTIPPCIGVNTTAGHWWSVEPILSPDFTETDHPCVITPVTVENGPMPGSYTYYCYVRRWVTIGADAGRDDEDRRWWLMLNIVYVYTNKGLIVKGLSGYNETYTLPGIKNYPQYACADGRDPEDIPNWEDTVLLCPADEDMHFCIEDFELAPEDSGE